MTTTTRKQQLLTRFQAIGQSLQTAVGALALIGFGSSGSETDRMDDYSDLDFFLIVQEGYKQQYIADLDWLGRVHPIAYAFANTPDGYKLLYEDGIFCEFAVMEPEELQKAAYTAEKIIWQANGFDPSWVRPRQPNSQQRPIEWQVGEAITNLYVGLGRYRRGEKLSAMRFVQWYAVDRVLELTHHVETEQPGHPDVFGQDRRFEQRFPETAVLLPQFTQGYENTVPSALAILTFLDTHFEVNEAMKREILALLGE